MGSIGASKGTINNNTSNIPDRFTIQERQTRAQAMVPQDTFGQLATFNFSDDSMLRGIERGWITPEQAEYIVQGFTSSNVSDTVENRIRKILDDPNTLSNAYSEQTINIGSRLGRENTILDSTKKSALVKEVKNALKLSGRKSSDYSVSITTPKLGPNVYEQYLKIVKKGPNGKTYSE